MNRLRSILFLLVAAGMLSACCSGGTCIKDPPCKPCQTPTPKCDPCAK